MHQRNRTKFNSLIAAMVLSLTLIGGLFNSTSVRAEVDLARDLQNFIDIAGTGNPVLVTSYLRFKAGRYIAEVVGTTGEWSAETLQAAMDIAVQARRLGEQNQVAMDALIPSVQGCVRESDGKPLEGITVMGIGVLPGTLGSALPMVATTQGGALPATVFGIPVVTELLSEQQQQNWGPGCYWMPMPPGWADLVGSAVSTSQEGLRFMKVFPMVVGYEMTPVAKHVTLADGEAIITDSSNVFNINADGDSVETTAN